MQRPLKEIIVWHNVALVAKGRFSFDIIWQPCVTSNRPVTKAFKTGLYILFIGNISANIKNSDIKTPIVRIPDMAEYIVSFKIFLERCS